MAKPVDPVPEGTKFTRLQAQINLGLFATHDWFMLILIVASLLMIGLCAVFGQLSWMKAIVLLLVACFFSLAWLIVLAYRCLVFILDAHASIELLPEAAARIAVGYFEGRPAKK